MIRIAIADDDKYVLAKLSERVKEYFEGQAVDCRIEIFTGGQELLCCGHSFELFFLDIQMGEQSGIETARRLRENGADGIIVFVTALPEYACDAFEVEAADYLIKPVEEKRFARTMERIFRRLQKRERGGFLLPLRGSACKTLPYECILYFEAIAHRIEIHTEDGLYECHIKMEDLPEMLDERFYQCHRSYLVNLDFVCGYENGQAVLGSKDKIPVSRLRGRGFSQAILKYMKEKKEG